jgi:hypothetical protein
MGKSWTTFKKLHRWPGLIISFILLYYGATGILMNHKGLFSDIDINRQFMPDNYEYKNWNNAALKGNLIISNDSILLFGNIGIWLTDSDFTNYASFNSGFSEGSDNRKISDVLRTNDGNLYAATLFGLYGYDFGDKSWHKFKPEGKEERFTGLEYIGDTIYALSRSYLFKGVSAGVKTNFNRIELPQPPGFDNKITLFETIWQIHSGEVFGLPGKLYVDLLGIITIFLSITGIIYFFFPEWIKRRLRRNRESVKIIRVSRWSLRWHNKVGAWTFVLLIILFFTGMFLRPPLLNAIAQAEVSPLKYSHLDQPNPWYDKLRDIIYDPDRKILLLSAYDGIYYLKPWELRPVKFENQPPVSVMGINVFQNYENGYYLVGSFTGLFLWKPESSDIFNYITGEPYSESGRGRPVGDYKITGLLKDTENYQFFIDYGIGVQPIHHNSSFPEMPENILKESKISLWNFCLEIHTGRIFESLTGGFYILIVPLTGIAGITVVLSGYMLWRRKYRKQGYNNIS